MSLIRGFNSFSRNAFKAIQHGRFYFSSSGRRDNSAGKRMLDFISAAKSTSLKCGSCDCAHNHPVAVGCPSVSVPVLSSTTTSTLRICSKATASLIRICWLAALPIPTINAVGVAKSQSTWTSNDKNRNSRQNTIRDIFTTTNGDPQYKCKNGNAQYDRYKNPRNTIDNALHGGFAALCFLHHSDNTGKHRFTAYLCGTNDK